MSDITENDIYVPGEWKCGECGFVVIKSIVDPDGKEIARSTASISETCPNDGTPLRRLRFSEACRDARETAVRVAEERDAAIEMLEKLVRRQAIVPSQIQVAERFLRSVGRAVRFA